MSVSRVLRSRPNLDAVALWVEQVESPSTPRDHEGADVDAVCKHSIVHGVDVYETEEKF